jgi:periplasmic divalent cation tolerance protein
MYVMLCNAPPDRAEPIARALVEEGLVACVNIVGPVRSLFVWGGKLCDEAESTLILKVPGANEGAVRARIKALHPYQTVEIVALAVDASASDPDYLAWVGTFARPVEPT